MSTKQLYQADSLTSGRYTLMNWQRVEIGIGPGIDRSQAQLIEGIEGEWLYVERSDWPVLVMPVSPPAPNDNAMVAVRDGLTFKGPFRGLYVQHPVLTLGGPNPAVPMRLSLLVGKTSDIDFLNQLSEPIAARNAAMSYRQLAGGTALTFQVAIYIPPGVRSLNDLRVSLPATTLTGCTIAPIDKDSGGIFAPVAITQNIAGLVATYNAASTYQVVGSFVPGASLIVGNLSVDFPKLPVPTIAREFIITFIGTGLSAVNLMTGVWS